MTNLDLNIKSLHVENNGCNLNLLISSLRFFTFCVSGCCLTESRSDGMNTLIQLNQVSI